MRLDVSTSRIDPGTLPSPPYQIFPIEPSVQDYVFASSGNCQHLISSASRRAAAQKAMTSSDGVRRPFTARAALGRRPVPQTQNVRRCIMLCERRSSRHDRSVRPAILNASDLRCCRTSVRAANTIARQVQKRALACPAPPIYQTGLSLTLSVPATPAHFISGNTRCRRFCSLATNAEGSRAGPCRLRPLH